MDDGRTTGTSHATGHPTESSGAPADGDSTPDELTRLRRRLGALQRERDHLATTVAILQDISASLHFVDILQTIARALGDTFGLDRCAIFLTGEKDEVRLVASYEDPNIRNLIVDINRYPELKRAFAARETVFIPDAPNDPMMQAVKSQLDLRNVRSIVVIPLEWQSTVIGAIFLRTDRDKPALSDVDLTFCQTVASLTAKALRNAHRFETLLSEQKDQAAAQRHAELERIALLGFVRRLLERHARSEGQSWSETLLPQAAGEELDRLVAVALKVFEEQARD
jgi:GAF domain-containing protein